MVIQGSVTIHTEGKKLKAKKKKSQQKPFFDTGLQVAHDFLLHREVEGGKKGNSALLGIALMALSERIPGVQVLSAH